MKPRKYDTSYVGFDAWEARKGLVKCHECDRVAEQFECSNTGCYPNERPDRKNVIFLRSNPTGLAKGAAMLMDGTTEGMI